MAKLLVEGDSELAKIKPRLELLAAVEGAAFVAEEDKFVLLPCEDSSPHLNPLVSTEIPHGVVSVEEAEVSNTNLPKRPQSFTGRSCEIHDLVNLILANRFVTLKGAGGIGKTAVAREAARWFHARGHFPDGVFQIDLREAETADAMIDLVGANLGVRGGEVEDFVRDVEQRHCLLLLDNVEDLVWRDGDAVRTVINAILQFAPGIKLLVTSQRDVGGNLHEPERIYPLGSLEPRYAKLLFLAVAKRPILPEELGSDSFHDLLEQWGGHPLSIVIGARQLGTGTTMEDLRERLSRERAKAIEVKGITDRDPQHGESLIASLSSAYEHLSEEAKRLFQILAMLPAGAQDFTVEQIVGAQGWDCAQELCDDASLAEITRFRRVNLLPPVRLFAEHVLTDEMRDEIGPKIVHVMGQYAQEFYEHHGAADAAQYRLTFALEEPNLRFAVNLPCGPAKSSSEPSDLGALGTHLIQLYVFHARLAEAESSGAAVIPGLRELSDRLGEYGLRLSMGDLAVRQSKLEAAGDHYGQALEICGEIGERLGEANTLRRLGDLAVRQEELEAAGDHYGQALEIFREIGRRLGEANTLRSVGDLAVRQDELGEAKKRYDEAVEIHRETGDRMGEANTLRSMGDLARREDELDDAKKRCDEALEIFLDIGDRLGEANTLWSLGKLAERQGEPDEAKKCYDEALQVFREIGDRLGEANTLRSLEELGQEG